MKLTLKTPIEHDGATITELNLSEPNVGAIEAFEAERLKERAMANAIAAKAAMDAGVPMAALGAVLAATVPPAKLTTDDSTATDDEGGFTAFVVLLARCASVDPDVIRKMAVSDLTGAKDVLAPFLSAMDASTGPAGAA